MRVLESYELKLVSGAEGESGGNGKSRHLLMGH